MADEAKLCRPVCSIFEGLVVQCVVTEKNWANSVDQCQLQELEVLVHLIDVLRLLLKCHGFTGIQKAGSNHQQISKQGP